jgi:hypothetical protein
MYLSLYLIQDENGDHVCEWRKAVSGPGSQMRSRDKSLLEEEERNADRIKC